MFDCIIVGAGPGGSSSAYHLAKKGHSVLVLDKADFPRRKSCGGGVSPAIAEWFDCDFSTVVENHVSQVKYTFKMSDPAEVELKGVTPMWMVQRDKFDNFLLEQAVSQGAEFKSGVAVQDAKLAGDIWQVSTSNGQFESKYLIAADGANSMMAKLLGFATPQLTPAASLQVPGEVSDRRKVTAFFDFGSLKNGFMWCFPKADGFSFSAAYVRNAKGKADELKKELYKYAELFNLDPNRGEYSEHPLNLWQENTPLHSDRALLVGEAAGMVDPLIGEGIRPALYTGVQAATAVSNAIAGDASALANYSKNVNQTWGDNLAKADFLAGLFFKAPKIAYKMGVKRPAAGQLMGKILCGELSYSQVADKATKKLKFIPGIG
ncbi:geranylgeranyl reductase family protein [Waterburya agarophytonicola K14]|uniref:Geranylgeranyl reductase family protein n=1 Tax=Waterburya agarophytonicola KI4 TaxID=2874699 RepID=A0A964FFP8_9CYAN|nr:geranylgeranyl reductase family protein [Waterburya agarophytonicola]MCC0177191.1 geranylgeranyl reductase family protein [Waterburya agarophytonicola KI4]